MPTFNIDAEQGIVFNTDLPTIPNCHSLQYLPVGIEKIAQFVRDAEINRLRRSRVQFVTGEFTPATDYLACCFHWFALSLINYLRLVGLVGILNRNGWQIWALDDPGRKRAIKEHCREYVRSVVPDIVTWRNKVGAHFAATDPFDVDNVGTLQASLMHPISYTRPYFETHAMRFAYGDQMSTIPSWRLTETYDRLTPRYWYDRPLPLLEEDDQT